MITRKEAHEIIRKAHWCGDNPVSKIEIGINNIYNSFEDRRCESCALVDTTDLIFERKCRLLGIACPDDFGCSEYKKSLERRSNER